MRMPAYALHQAGRAAVIVSSNLPNSELMSVLAPDAIVMQHPNTDDNMARLRDYKKLGIHTVYEIDDLLWELNPDNPMSAGFPKDMKQRVQAAMRICNKVLCSTPALALRVEQDLGIRKENIMVRQNRLPQWFVDAAVNGRGEWMPFFKEHRKPRVGWAGGNSHQQDLAILAPVVEATLDRYQWVFMGSCPEGMKDKVEFHPAVPLKDYPGKLGSLNLDLAVAPLADTPFNLCKSHLRIMEYAASGFAVLASDIGPFRHVHQSVMRVTNDTDAWIGLLEQCFEEDMFPDVQGRSQALHDNLKRHMLESDDSLRVIAETWVGAAVFEPLIVPRSGITHVVGEPIFLPDDEDGVCDSFSTIADAVNSDASQNVLYVRPGAAPTLEQISIAMHYLAEGADTVSALTNDGDYPVPGRFAPLPGEIAHDMEQGALNGCQGDTMSIPYPGGPFILISAAVLARMGLPDERRYEGDIETALLDWSMRGPGKHVMAPELFVPVLQPFQRDKGKLEQCIREITTWHPDLAERQQSGAHSEQHAVFRRNIDLAFHGLAFKSPPAASYDEWRTMHDTMTVQAKAWLDAEYASWANPPKVSIVLPTYNADERYLHMAIASITTQSYPNWELIIVDDASTRQPLILNDASPQLPVIVANLPNVKFIQRETNGHISAASNTGLEYCTGEWVLFLDHDDSMPPYALHMLVREVISRPELSFVYGDSDLIDPEGENTLPYFKPDFDYDLLLAQNYVCHPAMYRLDTVKQIGGFRSEFDGSQDYDLFLRYLEATCIGTLSCRDFSTVAAHVPMILYHWRQAPGSVSVDINSKPYAIKAAHNAVVGHLNRMKQMTFVGPHPAAPLHHLIRWLPPDPLPLVSIIILTEGNPKTIENCLGSLLTNTLYKNFEVLVRQGGDDKSLSSVIQKFAKADKRVAHIRAAKMRPFNFALLCNNLADTAEGQVLVFLNDDTAVLEGAWLHDMVGAALQPNIGAVGARLLYADRTVQHNGIIWNADASRGEAALHAYQRMPHNEAGPFGGAGIARQRMAVTAACMAIRKDRFDEMGGFDSVTFPLDYNDVDLCLRLRENGYYNLVLSHITLFHAEGATKRLTGATTRSAMLAAEERLRQSHVGLQDTTLNRANLEFDPSQQKLRGLPERPWLENADRPSILLIGVTAEEQRQSWVNGARPFKADLRGHLLQFTMPSPGNVDAIDMRDPLALADAVSRMGITRIVLRRLDNGSTEALGALARLAAEGFAVDYWQADYAAVCPRLNCHNSLGACQHEWKNGVAGCQACVDRDGSSMGYISVASYRMAWQHFMQAIDKSKQDSNVVSAQ